MNASKPGLVLPFLVALAAAAADADQKPAGATLELYRAKCQQCHMADGNSPLEPMNFADGSWRAGSKPEQIARVIAEGVPGSAMLPFKGQLDDGQIAELAAYVRSFDKKLKPIKGKR